MVLNLPHPNGAAIYQMVQNHPLRPSENPVGNAYVKLGIL